MYEELLEAYDRGGPPFERCLTRLGNAHWRLARDRLEEAGAVNAVTRQVAERHGMRIVLADARPMTRGGGTGGKFPSPPCRQRQRPRRPPGRQQPGQVNLVNVGWPW